jgi:hypothetical protein
MIWSRQTKNRQFEAGGFPGFDISCERLLPFLRLRHRKPVPVKEESHVHGVAIVTELLLRRNSAAFGASC